MRSRQAGSGYVSAGAAQASWAVPSGLRLAKLGVGLMAAMAAAAMAMYLRSTPAANTTSSSGSNMAAVEARSAAPAPSGGGATAAAGSSTGAAGSPAAAGDAAAAEATAPAGVGFHQWMVQRLQSTLEGFEAEQGLLKAELAALKGVAAAHSSQQGVLGGFRRWLGGSSKGGAAGDASSEMSAAAATAAAVSGGVTSAGRGTGEPGAGSAGDVASRVAEVQEQLESIAVLKAALAAELAEHQQMLRAAEQQQAASKERLAALAGR